MKKLVALALATTIAAGAAVATTGEAAAHSGPKVYFGFSFGGPGYYPYGYPAPYMYQPYLYPRVYPRPRLYSNLRWSKHVQWCSWRYKTYNPATNTYFKKKGVPAVCVSPYSY